MPRIRILPLDVEVECGDDATIMGAAQAQGYYWPTTCGGEARCTTCACEIIAGAEMLTAMGRAEERALVEERGPSILNTNVRLACQAHVRASGESSIVVRKAGVRRPESAGDRDGSSSGSEI